MACSIGFTAQLSAERFYVSLARLGSTISRDRSSAGGNAECQRLPVGHTPRQPKHQAGEKAIASTDCAALFDLHRGKSDEAFACPKDRPIPPKADRDHPGCSGMNQRSNLPLLGLRINQFTTDQELEFAKA